MIFKKCVLMFLLLASSVCYADDNKDWVTEEKSWLAVSTIALAVDWAQTRELTHHYDRKDYPPVQVGNTTYFYWEKPMHETNPILGRNPSMAKINTYFLSVIGLNYLIADNLSTHRIHWMMFMSAVEVNQIHKNVQLGLHVNF